jgi:parallel beta-helix repeat protein
MLLLMISEAFAEFDFVDFQGASEDQAVIDGLVQRHFTINAPKRVIYVAPFIEGSTQDGSGQSRSDPRRNLLNALESALPGDHYYLAPGVYRIDRERDNFGRDSSQFTLTHGGTLEDKIVVTTDPNFWDPENGGIAQIDFGFDNSKPNTDRRGIALYSNHWVFENLEIRNVNDWGFYVSGHYNLIRNNNIHHCNHPASNNTGLIVIGGSGELNNLVMGNHIHHSGRMDASGTLLPPSQQTGGNGGCTYSVTRQHYDTYDNLLAAGIDLTNDPSYPWKEMTWNELAQYITPPDNEAYFYNNHLDHCYPYGLATKNEAEGKFHFLSNIIHASPGGIKITLSHTEVRNNIVYNDDGVMEEAIRLANTPNGIKIVPQVINAVDVNITNNTFAGSDIGILHRAGWSNVISNNLFIDIPKPHVIASNYYAWGFAFGEYLYGDLSADHPYFDDMPQALKDQAGSYKQLKAQNNIYTVTPVLTTEHSNEMDRIAYLPNNKISDDYTVLTSEAIKAHLINPSANDFRTDMKNPGQLQNVGSGILLRSTTSLKPLAPTQFSVN